MQLLGKLLESKQIYLSHRRFTLSKMGLQNPAMRHKIPSLFFRSISQVDACNVLDSLVMLSVADGISVFLSRIGLSLDLNTSRLEDFEAVLKLLNIPLSRMMTLLL